MLIEAGAIKLSPVVTDELVGGFDTKKVSYSIDYRNLTVQQLTSIGLTPNDPSIYSTTQVAHWIDKNMMLDVKTHADIYQNGAKVGVYDNEYDVLELGGAAIPPKPSDVVETGSFVQAYNQWIGDLLAKESCAVKQQTEADECFKALAIRKRNWDDCKLIKGNGAFEACTLIIAQSTNNAVLCEKLTALADDCYIAIAGETGNYELCRKLYNTSLLANCTDAAADGKRKKDEEQQVLAKQVGLLGCGTDSDCKAQGAHKQFCMPKNSTGVPSGAEDNPLYACLSGVVCSCQQGSCGFNKTAAYYSCISDVEEALTRDFIAGLIPNNATNSASGK
jgi:hypothetical protein